jgi:hypothetical protein
VRSTPPSEPAARSSAIVADGATVTRGQTVRPTASAIGATRYRAGSRLQIRERHGCYWRCTACSAPVQGGDLYEAGSELGSPLCLACVETMRADETHAANDTKSSSNARASHHLRPRGGRPQQGAPTALSRLAKPVHSGNSTFSSTTTRVVRRHAECLRHAGLGNPVNCLPVA